MSHYGKVINGGARMTRGLTGGINDKIEGLHSKHAKADALAKAVVAAYTDRRENLSNPHLNQGINVGKFNQFKKPGIYRETNSVNIDLPKKSK